jgi:uncharacterized membrane protein
MFTDTKTPLGKHPADNARIVAAIGLAIAVHDRPVAMSLTADLLCARDEYDAKARLFAPRRMDRRMADVAALATACAMWDTGKINDDEELADRGVAMLGKVRDVTSAMALLTEPTPRGVVARRHAAHAARRVTPRSVSVRALGPRWRELGNVYLCGQGCARMLIVRATEAPKEADT